MSTAHMCPHIHNTCVSPHLWHESRCSTKHRDGLSCMVSTLHPLLLPPGSPRNAASPICTRRLPTHTSEPPASLPHVAHMPRNLHNAQSLHNMPFAKSSEACASRQSITTWRESKVVDEWARKAHTKNCGPCFVMHQMTQHALQGTRRLCSALPAE